MPVDELLQFINSDKRTDDLNSSIFDSEVGIKVLLQIDGSKFNTPITSYNNSGESYLFPYSFRKDFQQIRLGILMSAPKGHEKLLVSIPNFGYRGEINNHPVFHFNPIPFGEMQHRVTVNDFYGLVKDVDNVFFKYIKSQVLSR